MIWGLEPVKLWMYAQVYPSDFNCFFQTQMKQIFRIYPEKIYSVYPYTVIDQYMLYHFVLHLLIGVSKNITTPSSFVSAVDD